MSSGSKYLRTIHDCHDAGAYLTVDVYSVLQAFNVTNPGLQHAAKKILCAGIRGKGSFHQDITEAIDALQRALILEQAKIDSQV